MNKLLFVELAIIGGVRTATVETMKVFRVAILKGTVKVIFVQNHPSRELRPSADDEDITE